MSLAEPLLVFGAFALYAILHSILASQWAKGKSRALLGSMSDRVYRLTFNLLGGITFLPVLGVLAAYPGDTLYRIPWPWSLLTTVLQLAGAAIILIGMLQTDLWHFLGLQQLAQEKPTPESPLVTNGLYRHMRHPLYTGGLLLIWFVPQMTTGLLAFNLAASLYLYIGSFFEERRLIAAFGEAYRRYQVRVGRFFPRLRPPVRKAN
jgi:protein-S-isoprenylcysteine O-methyltransferase Ste14